VAKREARVLDAGGPAATVNPERLSVFQRVADRVSYGMGTPQNIIFWIIAVALWVAAGLYIAQHPFLPDWFTSNGRSGTSRPRSGGWAPKSSRSLMSRRSSPRPSRRTPS
jgi:hypothetical protein